MDKSMEMADGKILKLNNVLIRSGAFSDASGFVKVMHMFESYAKAKKLTPYGPLVLRTDGGASGATMMVQLREEHPDPDPPYWFEKLVRVKDCAMVRYRGPATGLAAAYAKLQVHAFENDITPGAMYTVYIEAVGERIMADVFMERAP